MPTWVDTAVHEYAKRLQDSITVQLIEIPLMRRSKSGDMVRIQEKEASLMEAAIPSQARLIALDMSGIAFNSEGLASKLAQFQQTTPQVCLLIGGPEGLSPSLLSRCQEHWSLSKLTLPHPIVRIVLLEALYRAWSILHHHPYHK